MKYEIVTLEEKTAAGISARTNNHSPEMKEVIGGLWSRFYQDGIYSGISDKADKKALCIYNEYEGGADDDYTAMVCCRVNSLPGQKAYSVCRIPAGTYAKFVIRCRMEEAVETIGAAWQEIWNMDLPRTYLCDFEEYQDSYVEQTEIHLYVGLKESET